MQALISPLKELAEFQQMKEELKRGSPSETKAKQTFEE